MPLPDPRPYPAVNIHNPLICLASSPQNEQAEQQIEESLAKLLANGDDTFLTATFSQLPSAESWARLSETLSKIIEKPVLGKPTSTIVFAIPVIIVAGSQRETSLSCKIDPQRILEFLRQQGVLASDAPAIISSTLSSHETLSSIAPSQLLAWKTNSCQQLRKFSDFPDEPIAIKEESAWLRFITGAIEQTSEDDHAIRLGDLTGSWIMPFSRMLSEILQQGDANILVMPRAPYGWLSALGNGRRMLLETRLQLLTSNAIRAIRSKRRTPVGIICAHENGEIRITISSQEDSERWYGFVWPLTFGECIEQVEKFVYELFCDCRIDDIRIIDAIQPELDGELPFFVTAHFLPRRYLE